MVAEFKSLSDLAAGLRGLVQLTPDGTCRVTDAKRFREGAIDRLAWTAVFTEDPPTRESARWLIRGCAQDLGAVSASIQGLYDAFGAGRVSGFTVPAHNLRGMVYDKSRALFRAAKKTRNAAFIFEIAKSEQGYCFLKPAEYTVSVLAAAVKEGYQGPVFLQGDHYQFNAKKHTADPEKEAQIIRDLIRESVPAGFLNIDIDSSTLVDLSKPNVLEQQRWNFERAAEMTKLIRELEPKGVAISVGGEIGEVGKKNSTVEELREYMRGYKQHQAKIGGGNKTISKMSVQTGTSHGGIPGPDGKVVEVEIDFGTLRAISEACRNEFGLGGAVQHGASTLPGDLFDRFPQAGTVEIHLATEFQNMVLDHAQFPKDLKTEIYAWLDKNCQDEAKPGQTKEQYYYKTRKKAWGPFKRKLWDMADAPKAAILKTLEDKFEFLMKKLNAVGTEKAVHDHVRPVPVWAPMPEGLKTALA